MTPYSHLAKARPTGVADVHQVEGGLWQARCVCRWRGRRRSHNETATCDALEHVQHCGTCKIARANMATCSCMSCQRARDVRERWHMPLPGATSTHADGKRECQGDHPATEPSCSNTCDSDATA